MIYNVTKVLLAIAATAVGLALVVMALRFYFDFRVSVWVPHLHILLAFLLTLIGVMVFSLALPTATHADLVEKSGTQVSCEGPCDAFIGRIPVSALFGLAQATWQWGPSPGWIVGLVAAVTLAILVILLSVPHFRSSYERID